jgi:hypothetical protein
MTTTCSWVICATLEQLPGAAEAGDVRWGRWGRAVLLAGSRSSRSLPAHYTGHTTLGQQQRRRKQAAVLAPGSIQCSSPARVSLCKLQLDDWTRSTSRLVRADSISLDCLRADKSGGRRTDELLNRDIIGVPEVGEAEIFGAIDRSYFLRSGVANQARLIGIAARWASAPPDSSPWARAERRNRGRCPEAPRLTIPVPAGDLLELRVTKLLELALYHLRANTFTTARVAGPRYTALIRPVPQCLPSLHNTNTACASLLPTNLPLLSRRPCPPPGTMAPRKSRASSPEFPILDANGLYPGDIRGDGTSSPIFLAI